MKSPRLIGGFSSKIYIYNELLNFFDIFSAEATSVILVDFEINVVALVETLITFFANDGTVVEEVILVILGTDKTKTFFLVEHLDRSLHNILSCNVMKNC